MSIIRPVENSLLDRVCNSDEFKQIFLVGRLYRNAYNLHPCLQEGGMVAYKILAAPFILAVALLDIPFWVGKTVVLLCINELTGTHFKNFPRLLLNLLTIAFLFPIFVVYVPIGMRGKTDQRIRAVIKKFQNKEYGDLNIEKENKRRTFDFVNDLKKWCLPSFGCFGKLEDRLYEVIIQLLIETNYSMKSNLEFGSGSKGSMAIIQLIQDLINARYPDHTLPWQTAKGFINVIVGNCVSLPRSLSQTEQEKTGEDEVLEKAIEQQIGLLKTVLASAKRRTECSWELHQTAQVFSSYQETNYYHVPLLMGLVHVGGMQTVPSTTNYKPDGRICKNGNKPFANEDNVFSKLLKELIVTGKELAQFEDYVELFKQFLDKFSETVNAKELSEQVAIGNIYSLGKLVDQMHGWLSAHCKNPYVSVMRDLIFPPHRRLSFETLGELKTFFGQWADCFKERADNILKLKKFLLQDSQYHQGVEIACPTLGEGVRGCGHAPIIDMIFDYMQ